jgi:Na+-driven multidrug efflux pump
VADLGTASFAAHQIASQLMALSYTFAEGIGAATTSLVGQNLGRNRPDLSIMYGKIGQRVAFFIAVCLSIISVICRFFFASLFTDDQAIIALTANLTIILACILPVQTSHIVMGGSLRGAGDVKYVALTMLITVTFIRPVASYILVYVFGMGLEGAWYGLVFDQVIRMVLLFRRFSKGKWINITV